MKFSELAERQIRKAQMSGALDKLEGEGKPLPYRPGDALIDTADAVGHRIMAEAGALPEEIKLKKQLTAAREAWQAATDPVQKKALMAKFADLELRHSIAREARQKFLR